LTDHGHRLRGRDVVTRVQFLRRPRFKELRDLFFRPRQPVTIHISLKRLTARNLNLGYTPCDYIADHIFRNRDSEGGNMQIKVAIYERVKIGGQWVEKHIPTPKTIKKDGTLFVKDQREGSFIISSYEDRKKKRQTVDGRDLSDAVALAKSKAWYLNNCREHEVRDPTITTQRPGIEEQIPLYLDAKSGCPRTIIAHRLALRQFQNYCAIERVDYVDEITKPIVRRWFDKLVANGNSPLTAAIKVLRANAFYRAVMHLDPGKGVISKKDYKRELVNGKVVEMYTRQELDHMFEVMGPDEHLVFSVLLEAGLRKKELMHLEDSDLICDEFLPGTFKCELKIESKPRWGHLTKTGHHRKVLIGKELMDRLLAWKEKPRPSALLFGTKGGQPDWHWWDRLKKVAERCGVNPDTMSLQKFRSTAATTWLRPKERGGYGWDISFVRQQLGHEDYKSVERYLVVVKNEEMAMTLVPRRSDEAA